MRSLSAKGPKIRRNKEELLRRYRNESWSQSRLVEEFKKMVTGTRAATRVATASSVESHERYELQIGEDRFDYRYARVNGTHRGCSVYECCRGTSKTSMPHPDFCAFRVRHQGDHTSWTEELCPSA